MSSGYQFAEIEQKWRAFWEETGCFNASASSPLPPYAISIPPPNVTGVLHMGHALVDTLQDILIRWKRMSGFEAVWIPGTDHAGIATQTVVEKRQIATTGKRRQDFSREEFLALVWDWKEKSEKTIVSQIKELGCSCDWDRLAFTMDKERSFAVRTLFKKMFDEGLIYRGDYLVNWDPQTQTALADDEVEYEEHNSSLWYIRYFLEGGKDSLIVATTRPETMLADMAVAVHPSDPRYASFIGKRIVLPLSKRLIPIVADPFVDPEFGTGAVKITPAHDFNDYELAHRHDLPLLNLMTPDGKINEVGGEFAGLSMKEARAAVVDKLKKEGFLERVDPHLHRVGISYRSKAIIEPYLSKQWFVKMAPFKEKLLRAVEEKKVVLIPEQWNQTYFHWIKNLRDWCISRQLWWGHQIPIWYHRDDPSRLLCSAEEGGPKEVRSNPEDWVQDPDVLDTWFSSALWPFSVLGWPEKTADMEKFYPNAVLVTGHDILFFWVARMILMGEYATGKLPFKEVFLHGLIYSKSYWKTDPIKGIQYLSGEERLPYEIGKPLPSFISCKWEKMSKSKGNVIDPLEILQTYGTDATRMTLCSVATHALQIDLDRRRFEEYKNFVNKIWNGARFIFLQIEDLSFSTKGIDLSLCTLDDQWILLEQARFIKDLLSHLTSYHFDQVAQAMYRFFWDELCAYYLECSKPYFKEAGHPLRQNKQHILFVLLLTMLRAMHPVLPFITEELFQTMKHRFGFEEALANLSIKEPYLAESKKALSAKACMLSCYPTPIFPFSFEEEQKIDEEFALLQKVIYALRNIRAEMQIAPSTTTDLYIEAAAGDSLAILIEKQELLIRALVKLRKIEKSEKVCLTSTSAKSIVGSVTLIIPLPEEMQAKEKERLAKLHAKLLLQQKGLEERLANQEFTEKAPAALVAKAREELFSIQTQLSEIEKTL